MLKSFHHEGTKDTKVSEKYYSEVRDLRAFVVKRILSSLLSPMKWPINGANAVGPIRGETGGEFP
jgi:hypothetical protein